MELNKTYTELEYVTYLDSSVFTSSVVRTIIIVHVSDVEEIIFEVDDIPKDGVGTIQATLKEAYEDEYITKDILCEVVFNNNYFIGVEVIEY